MQESILASAAARRFPARRKASKRRHKANNTIKTAKHELIYAMQSTTPTCHAQMLRCRPDPIARPD